MQLRKFKLFEKLDHLIKHGLSLRAGGVSEGSFKSLNLGLDVGDDEKNVTENYRRFCEEAGVPSDKICVAFQEHSDRVMMINDEAVKDIGGIQKPFVGMDGFMTDILGIPLMVRFADCQGALFYDPVKGVIAAVHSGWRGNAQNILGKTVRQMQQKYNCLPSDILVGISPSLGPCCADFTDPLNELPPFMHVYVSGKKINLWDCTFDQLTYEGILPEHIEMARECTVCNNDKYFSFRAGKQKSGHMGAVIELIP